MAYQLKYQLLSAPEPRTDGSGMVTHDIQAIYSADDGETWQSVLGSGYHRSVNIPTADLQAVAATSGGNSAIVAAYKDAIRDNGVNNTQPTPLLPPSNQGWNSEGLEAYLALYAAWVAEKAAIDAAASSIAATADNFITVTLGQEYPVEFSL